MNQAEIVKKELKEFFLSSTHGGEMSALAAAEKNNGNY